MTVEFFCGKICFRQIMGVQRKPLFVTVYSQMSLAQINTCQSGLFGGGVF